MLGPLDARRRGRRRRRVAPGLLGPPRLDARLARERELGELAAEGGEGLHGTDGILVALLGELDHLLLDGVGTAGDPGSKADRDAALDVPGVGRHPKRRLAR